MFFMFVCLFVVVGLGFFKLLFLLIFVCVG